jgi:hypothetical protein
MKTLKNLFFAFCLTVMNFSIVLAQGSGNPAAPSEGGAPPPDGEDVPIDQGLAILLICGLLFGIFAIYKYNLNKKASM